MPLPHALKHPQPGAIEGVSVGLDPARLRIRHAARSTGHIDALPWRKYRDHCRVRRFWAGSDNEVRRLVHRLGGAEHARRAFHYDASAEGDEAGIGSAPMSSPGRVSVDRIFARASKRRSETMTTRRVGRAGGMTSCRYGRLIQVNVGSVQPWLHAQPHSPRGFRNGETNGPQASRFHRPRS
jgi:hypothetical protein